MSWFAPIEGGFEIQVLAVPRSSRSRVAGVHDDCVKVQLAAHEYPRFVQFADTLPMTATGKVLRRELRALG